MVLENGDIVDGGLDAQDPAKLVVHLDWGTSHVVLNGCALDARVEVVADLACKSHVEAAAEKSRDHLASVGGIPVTRP